MRIGMPGRHFAAEDFFANTAGPRASLSVIQERHRRGFARSVALDAILEEDRRHILVESDDCIRLSKTVGVADGDTKKAADRIVSAVRAANDVLFTVVTSLDT